MMVTLFHLGEFAAAMDHFEKVVQLYGSENDRDDSLRYTGNLRVNLPSFAAWVLWFLGRPDESLKWIEKSQTLARELSEPHALAHALFFGAFLHQLRRETRMAKEQAEATIDVCTEHGFGFYQMQATITRGWALIEQGLRGEGIEQMRQGLAARQATGAELTRPHFLGLLAEALGNDGQVEEGLALLQEALGAADRTGERCYDAELWRLKGEILFKEAARRDLSTGKVGVGTEVAAMVKAQQCFHQAIEIAQRQKANSLELRAAMSLARFRQTQGKRQEARDLLAETYNKFTEGFDTVDLREARELLHELS